MNHPYHDAADYFAANSESFAAVQEQGDYHASLGQSVEALRCFEKAAQLDPDAPQPYIGLGVVAIEDARLDDADIAFRVACRLDATSSKGYAGLAMVAQQRGDYQDAFSYYLKSLERDSDNMTALLGLFQASCQMGSFAQVIHYLELYLTAHPQDTSVMFSLAALYVKDGLLLKAKRVLFNLLQVSPENQEAANLLEEVDHSLTRQMTARQRPPTPNVGHASVKSA